MSLQSELQSALENLAQAAQRLEQAAEVVAAKQREIETLRGKCGDLQSALDRAGQDLEREHKNESDFERLRAERDELIAVRNRLIAEKNQLLGERDQFKKFREGWARERPALIKAKEDAESEVKRLQNGAENGGGERIAALDGELAALRAERDALSGEKQVLTEQKESLSIELDGVKQAYDELKRTAAEASERLDSTLEELKILRG